MCFRVSFAKSCVILSNFALLKLATKCFGPLASAVINGKLISVFSELESSFFASSALSLSLCIAILSWLRSIPFLSLKSATNQSIIALSKSSPPKNALPSVLKTSNVPSLISKTVTSNVPPPKSYTTTFSSCFLSSP